MPVELLLQCAILGVVAFTLSLVAPFAVRPLLRRRGIVDVPNERSSHTVTAIRGLGIGVWIALVVTLLIAFLQTYLWVNMPLGGWIVVVVMTVLCPAVGLLEDLRGLRVLHRSILQLMIAAACAGIVFIALPQLPFVLQILIFIFGVLFISSFINVANFMDGLNGISGFSALVAGIAFALIGWLCEVPWLLLGGILLAAVFGGFLPWNLRGYGFLGDVGSYLLGGWIIGLSWLSLLSDAPILAAIGPTVVYFGDVGFTLVRRLRRGEKLGEAHKEHAYQRLQQLGYSHVAASGIAALCSAVAALLGIASLWLQSWQWFAVLGVAGLLVVIGYFMLPGWIAKRDAR